MSGGKGGAAPAAGSASPAGLTVPLSIWKKGAACLCLSPAMGERPLPPALVKRCPCPSSPGFGPVRWLLNESEAGRSPSHGGLTCCLHGRSRRSFICPSWLSQSQARPLWKSWELRPDPSLSIPLPSPPHPWCSSSFPLASPAAQRAVVPFLTALKATKASPAHGLACLAPQVWAGPLGQCPHVPRVPSD